MKHFNNPFSGVAKPLLILPIVLAAISIVLMLSTSYDEGIHFTDKTVIVQTAAYVLGWICVFILANIDYTVFQEYTRFIYIGSIIFLLLVYIPGLGIEVNGSRAWINLRIMTFQPSELVKITFILLMANYFMKRKNELYTFVQVLKALIYALPFIGLVLIQDLGSALVFFAIWVVMIFYAGIRGSLFAKCAALVAVCVPASYFFLADYQKERIKAFLFPDDLSLAGNYQVWQSKVAIGSGGFLGKGLFQGTQKSLEFLPVRNSDFVFSVLIEETGFIGGALLIAVYTWLIQAILKVSRACKDMYGRLIIMGIVGMFAFQIFENIGMTIGIMPCTGITLPFISYGGSSILSNMIAMGFVINIAIANRTLQY